MLAVWHALARRRDGGRWRRRLRRGSLVLPRCPGMHRPLDIASGQAGWTHASAETGEKEAAWLSRTAGAAGVSTTPGRLPRLCARFTRGPLSEPVVAPC